MCGPILGLWVRAAAETIKAALKALGVLTQTGVKIPPIRHDSEAIVYSAEPSWAR